MKEYRTFVIDLKIMINSKISNAQSNVDQFIHATYVTIAGVY